MSIITRQGNSVTIKPEKDLVATHEGEFRAEFQTVIKSSLEVLIIDLADVEMVDSGGISLLISIYNQLKEFKAELKLINVDQNLYELFTTMLLDKHFSIEKP